MQFVRTNRLLIRLRKSYSRYYLRYACIFLRSFSCHFFLACIIKREEKILSIFSRDVSALDRRFSSSMLPYAILSLCSLIV